MTLLNEKPLSESPITPLLVVDFGLEIDVLPGMNISHRIDVSLHSSISIVARVHAGASLSVVVIGDVTDRCVIDRRVFVVGDAAAVDLSSSIRTRGNARCNISDDIDVKMKDSQCTIDNRIVAYDASRAVIRERIVVHSLVVGGTVTTSIRGMLVGDDASIRAIPELDIATNTVNAKHAVSIARPNVSALAYCASRGIDCENAIAMIADGLLCPAGSMMHISI